MLDCLLSLLVEWRGDGVKVGSRRWSAREEWKKKQYMCPRNG